MPTKPRKPLEDWQKKDAERLRAIWLAFKARQPKASRLSESSFGEQMEIGSQGMVWQYLNGHTPLNIDAAEKFARGLECNISDFSQTLSRRIARAAGVALSQLDEPDPKAHEIMILMEGMSQESLTGLLGVARALVKKDRPATIAKAAPKSKKREKSA